MKKTIITPDGIQEVDLTPEETTETEARKKEWNDNAFNRSITNLREKRNRLLADTDFYALSDVTLSDNIKTYRQELRDLPSGLTTVEEVEAKEFPTKPQGDN